MKKTKLRLKQLPDNRVVIVRISDDINRIPPKSRILQALADCYLGVGGLVLNGIVPTSPSIEVGKTTSSTDNGDDDPSIGPAGYQIVLKIKKVKP